MDKYFRFHRSTFEDSITTMREVKDLEDIRRWVNLAIPSAQNIRISQTKYSDPRTPREWQCTTHYVLADFGEYESQCVGMCNFYEE